MLTLGTYSSQFKHNAKPKFLKVPNTKKHALRSTSLQVISKHIIPPKTLSVDTRQKIYEKSRGFSHLLQSMNKYTGLRLQIYAMVKALFVKT